MRYKPFIAILALAAFCAAFIGAQDKQDALEKYGSGQFDDAVKICLAELDAQNAGTMDKNMDSYAVLGWSLLKLKRYDEAVKYAELGRQISKFDPRIIEILGEAKFYNGKTAESLKLFQEYIGVAPEGARIDTVYYFIGEIYIMQGSFNLADIAMTTAIYHNPNNANWWARTGYAREMAKNYQTALDAYNQCLKLNPQQGDAQRGKDRVSAKLKGQ
jgi:tetratricopeptide (TPR) repeat protein